MHAQIERYAIRYLLARGNTQVQAESIFNRIYEDVLEEVTETADGPISYQDVVEAVDHHCTNRNISY